MTYSNCKTEDGRITVYFSEGAFTGEPIEDGYFGCGRRGQNRRPAG